MFNIVGYIFLISVSDLIVYTFKEFLTDVYSCTDKKDQSLSLARDGPP